MTAATTKKASHTQTTTIDRGLTEKLGNLCDHLGQGLVERDVEVQAALLALVAGEHILLIGEPGTAKSMIARRLTSALADATCFERLLTRFTTPDELFGPFSIKGLENDEYRRLVEGYLPTASVVFLDEIFKANSAILNALLTLLNERAFHNGRARQDTPLKAVVAASNEVPEEGELDALFDRFLLRLRVSSVSDEFFDDLLTAEVDEQYAVPEELRLTDADLAAIRQASVAVALPDDVRALLGQLRTWCAEQQLHVSDRRWRKIIALLKTSAATHGRTAVLMWDCLLLEHCLLDLRTETSLQEKLGELVVGRSNEVGKLNQWVDALEEHAADATDEDGYLLYLDGEGRTTRASTRQQQITTFNRPMYLFVPDVVAELIAQNKGRLSDRTVAHSMLDERQRPVFMTELGLPDFMLEAYIADPRTHAMRTVENEPLVDKESLDDASDVQGKLLTQRVRLKEQFDEFDKASPWLWLSERAFWDMFGLFLHTDAVLRGLAVRLQRFSGAEQPPFFGVFEEVEEWDQADQAGS